MDWNITVSISAR